MDESSDELDLEEPQCPRCALSSIDLESVKEALLHPQFGYTGPYGSIPLSTLRLLRGETLHTVLTKSLEEHMHLAHSSTAQGMVIFRDFARAHQLASTLVEVTSKQLEVMEEWEWISDASVGDKLMNTAFVRDFVQWNSQGHPLTIARSPNSADFWLPADE